MNSTLAENISKASEKAYIGGEIKFEDEYRPQLVCNKPDMQVFNVITSELADCEEFWFSVAFITFGGVADIKGILKDLIDSNANVKGHILTTDFQNFTEPSALRSLMDIDFIDIKVAAGEKFHTKGYCFRKKDVKTGEDKYTILVGSSNLTRNALKVNKEWNVQSVSKQTGQFTIDFLNEFNNLWNASKQLTEEWLEEYEITYAKNKHTFLEISKETMSIINPNYMQRKALDGLKALRARNQKRGLLIAATGTGKTYLSAFDVRNVNPSKMLYVVHREQILDKAIESFQDVLGKEEFAKNYGKFAGGDKVSNKKYTFATIQSFSQPGVKEKFPRNYFDYIIIDEVHKAGAPTYQEFIDYFDPDFLLGMSATPDRPDRFNIYELFGYNIAYEIRLKDALEAELVCPFNYYGVSDDVDDSDFTTKGDLSVLVSERRVNLVLDSAKFYGYDGDKLQGLIFCSSTKEGIELSSAINKKKINPFRNYRTVFMDGDTPVAFREQAIARLSLPETDPQSLDYLITVDIFNEGIDIPEVNQVLLLRPTQSAIIFTQQLGRGLRKCSGKGGVVVIDFIGNYKNNFMIPIALFGDNTYSKDNVRRYVSEGSRCIPGSSTMHFDKIAKEKIFRAIDKGNFFESKLIKNAYIELKNKLGHIPSMQDFDDYHAYNILNIISHNDSYYSFLCKEEEEFDTRLSESEAKLLRFISKKYASGKSRPELELVRRILDEKYEISCDYTSSEIRNACRGLSLEFSSTQEQEYYEDVPWLVHEDSNYYESNVLKRALANSNFCELVRETVDYGLRKNTDKYQNLYKNTKLVLYEKYSYEDASRLFGWKSNLSSVMNGYWYDEDTNVFLIFINYEKEGDAIAYGDAFIDHRHFAAISKKNRTIKSNDKAIIYKEKIKRKKVLKDYTDCKHYLFVRKNKKDVNSSKEFYFLGEVNAIGQPDPFKLGKHNVFKVIYELESPVRNDIYDYLNSKI